MEKSYSARIAFDQVKTHGALNTHFTDWYTHFEKRLSGITPPVKLEKRPIDYIFNYDSFFIFAREIHRKYSFYINIEECEYVQTLPAIGNSKQIKALIQEVFNENKETIADDVLKILTVRRQQQQQQQQKEKDMFNRQ